MSGEWLRVGGHTTAEWAEKVRDRWKPWLDLVPIDSWVLANEAAYWRRLGKNDWRSGDNRVSTLTLLSMHDYFRPIADPTQEQPECPIADRLDETLLSIEGFADDDTLVEEIRDLRRIESDLREFEAQS